MGTGVIIVLHIPENTEYCPYCGSTNIIIKKKIKLDYVKIILEENIKMKNLNVLDTVMFIGVKQCILMSICSDNLFIKMFKDVLNDTFNYNK